MNVQRCPSCAARYNVARLEPGATFACRRCDALVTVGGPTEPAGRPISVGLLTGSVLMLGAVFLMSNPWFGISAQAWPWEQFLREDSLPRRASFLLWVFVALWGLITSLTPGLRWRSVLTVPLAAFLLLLCFAEGQAGFAIREKPSFAWMLGVVALAGGLEGMRRGRTGLGARALALGGGLTTIWWHAMAFQAEGTQLEVLARDLGLLFQGTLGEVEGLRRDYKWETLIAYWAVLVACGVGLVSALFAPHAKPGPSGGPEPGILGEILALGGLLFLLAGFLLPPSIAILREMREVGSLDLGWRVLARQGTFALVSHGIALWVLASYAVADLHRGRGAPA